MRRRRARICACARDALDGEELDVVRARGALCPAARHELEPGRVARARRAALTASVSEGDSAPLTIGISNWHTVHTGTRAQYCYLPSCVW